MKLDPSGIVLLSLLVSGCATQSQLSASYAKKCEDAELKGVINLAELACERAWFGVDAKSLDPEIQSERLYNLARIKRQLKHYEVANNFIRQSLTIEETVTAPNSTAYGLRLVELSLSLAGQGKFTEGASALARVLQVVDQFSVKDQDSTANILKHYASILRNTDQKQLAIRFEQKATELKAYKNQGT